MIDPRIKQLAKVLVNYSIKIKEGDTISIDADAAASPLVLEVYKLLLQKGAFPKVNFGMPGFAYAYYKYASTRQLYRFPELAWIEAKKSDAHISIGGEYNTRELTSVEAKKIAIRHKITKRISDLILKKNKWVICDYPTHALAQDAEMSLEEMEDFVFSACLQDWEAMERRQEQLKRVLDEGAEVRIVGKNTDLGFSIKNRQAIKDCVRYKTPNMPAGEVFIAPVESSTEGHIEYSFPAIYHGKEVDGIRLEFKKGNVFKASATKNEDLLLEMIKLDKGARRLGEFGVGTNFGIKKFVKEILFDEKIGGTIHLALGMAYKEGGGRNNSALHWDMIRDLRREGKVLIDGKVLLEKGRFHF